MKIICIVCPNSCVMEAQLSAEGVEVTGNTCKRGESFAKQELTCPMRTVTTTVRTVFDDFPVLPVKTTREVKKSEIPLIMKNTAGVCVDKRLCCGDIAAVLPDGTELCATEDMD